MVRAGADVHHRSLLEHRSALCLAAEFNDEAEVLDALIQAGADVNAVGEFGDGRTPLILAVFEFAFSISPQSDKVELLIQAGADVNAQDEDGNTALMKAAWRDDAADIARLLLNAGAEVNLRSKDGYSALLCAANSQQRRAVSVLLEAGAEVNVSSEEGATPLILAMLDHSTEAPQMLIDAGADVNYSDPKDGLTALIYAARLATCPAIIYALLDAGADGTARDVEGKSAFDEAKTNEALRGDSDLMAALQRACIDSQ